jgi:hypothetical protein
MPAPHHISSHGLAVAVAVALLIPALSGVPMASSAALASRAGMTHAEAADAGLVPGGAAAVQAPGARQPKVTEVRLSGIDRAVLADAPEPAAHDAHDHADAQPGPADLELVPAVVSEVDIADPATLVAVSADAPFPVGSSIQVRVLEGDDWSAWAELHVDDSHGPDPGSVEAANVKVGSAPLMTSGAIQAQIRIDTPTGAVPAGTELTVVEAPPSAGDALLGTEPTGSGGRMSARMAPAMAGPVPNQTIGAMPQVFTRAQWGADESLRSREPLYTDTVKAGFIHHTASTSSYSEAQAAAQVRAIYAYHTKSLGHSDIDYNFLVDRFGRLYEGRYGGMDRPVLGAHTAGFNEQSFAVVALGNFETYFPPAAELALMRDAIARLFAWKLGLHGGNPGQTVSLVSAGYIRATKYPKGTVATIPAMSTHQTVNFTACPGKYVQAEVPAIRSLAVAYADAAVPPLQPATDTFMAGDRVSVEFVTEARHALQWTAHVLGPCTNSAVRTLSGNTSGPGPVTVAWDLRDGSGTMLLPGTYRVRVTGATSDGVPLVPLESSVTITPKPGGPWGPCPQVNRIVGQSTAETSVLWGRTTAPTSRIVVLTAPADAGESSRAAGVAAAPLARSLGAPLLLTSASALDAAIAADIRGRAAPEVIIVGAASVVSDAVATAVSELGVKVTRLAGADDAATAAAVAQRMPATRTAVLVSPTSSPAHALAGAALAAARRVPVLFVTLNGVPKATRSALANRTSVTVVVPTDLSKTELSAGLGRIRWVRLSGSTSVSASVVVARAHPTTAASVTLLPSSSASWAIAPAAAANGRPLLFTDGSALSSSVASLLRARTAIRSAAAPVLEPALTGTVLGAASRALVPTAAMRLTTANAAPEPVRRGRTITVSARVTAKYTDGSWRAARNGVKYSVKFKARGASSYTVVARGTTVSGTAKATVRATRSGRFVITVASTTSGSDYVTVTR